MSRNLLPLYSLFFRVSSYLHIIEFILLLIYFSKYLLTDVFTIRIHQCINRDSYFYHGILLFSDAGSSIQNSCILVFGYRVAKASDCSGISESECFSVQS